MKRFFAIFLPSLILLSVSLFFIPFKRALVISNRKDRTQKIISTNAIDEGFIISYTHSVNKGRVHDFYKITDDNFLNLYQTKFVSYGAGIPEPYETEGAVFEATDDGYYIKNINRIIPSLMMAVGVIANHSIIIGNNIDNSICSIENKDDEKIKNNSVNKDTLKNNKEIFLTRYFLPQTSLIFEIKRLSIFNIHNSIKI